MCSSDLYSLSMAQASMGILPDFAHATPLTPPDKILVNFDDDSSDEELDVDHRGEDVVDIGDSYSIDPSWDIFIDVDNCPVEPTFPCIPQEFIECAIDAPIPIVSLEESILPVHPILPDLGDGEIVGVVDTPLGDDTCSIVPTFDMLDVDDTCSIEPIMPCISQGFIDFSIDAPILIDTLGEYVLPVAHTLPVVESVPIL